jgi:hypothetical protein
MWLTGSLQSPGPAFSTKPVANVMATRRELIATSTNLIATISDLIATEHSR